VCLLVFIDRPELLQWSAADYDLGFRLTLRWALPYRACSEVPRQLLFVCLPPR
jgi:hypothetical protein